MNNEKILICYKFTNKYNIIQDYCDIKYGKRVLALSIEILNFLPEELYDESKDLK